ncbi:MAG: hypothetical protein WCJ18_11550, partial [Planctomycetota bacterium]
MRKMVGAGRVSEALQVAKSERAVGRTKLLFAVADGLIKKGDKESARRIYESVFQSVRRVRDSKRRMELMRDLACAFATLGMVNMALECAAQNEEFVKQVANTLATEGNVLAFKEIENLIAQHGRCANWLKLAEQQSEAGREDRAEEMLQFALKAAAEIKDIEQCSECLKNCVEACVRMERFEQAEAIADRIQIPAYQALTLVKLAEELFSSKCIEGGQRALNRALTIQLDTEELREQTTSLLACAKAVAASGDEEIAGELLLLALDQQERIRSTCEFSYDTEYGNPDDFESRVLLEALLAVKECEAAFEILPRPQKHWLWIDRCNRVARALVLVGEERGGIWFRRLLEVLTREELPSTKGNWIFGDVARGFAEGGMWAWAAQVLELGIGKLEQNHDQVSDGDLINLLLGAIDAVSHCKGLPLRLQYLERLQELSTHLHNDYLSDQMDRATILRSIAEGFVDLECPDRAAVVVRRGLAELKGAGGVFDNELTSVWATELLKVLLGCGDYDTVLQEVKLLKDYAKDYRLNLLEDLVRKMVGAGRVSE